MATFTRDRLEQILIDAAKPSAANVFTRLYVESARAAADASDARLASSGTLGPVDGMIISVKDNTPIAGEATMSGGIFASEIEVADELEIVKLRGAGAIIIGKTSMTEFGMDPIGIKARAIPLNAVDPLRVTGGSTSGGSVSVALNLCDSAIGTDTLGSNRIPAAWQNLVGMATTNGRLPRYSRQLLSYTFGVVGNMARDVATVANVDAVMANITPTLVTPPINTIRIGIARGLPFSSMVGAIAIAIEDAVSRLSVAGATVTDMSIDPFMGDDVLNAFGAIVRSEAASQHRQLLADRPNDYLPYTRDSLALGLNVLGTTYIEAQRYRQQIRRAMQGLFQSYDVLLIPTVRFYAPPLQDLLSNDDLFLVNARRSQYDFYVTSFCNLPAITIPLPGLPSPAGLMLIAKTNNDRALLGIAAAVENLIRNA
jgi:aspartyl-tRNA(Asn)/glutamyl-tRNA(Gln) amidotransferase subunit A